MHCPHTVLTSTVNIQSYMSEAGHLSLTVKVIAAAVHGSKPCQDPNARIQNGRRPADSRQAQSVHTHTAQPTADSVLQTVAMMSPHLASGQASHGIPHRRRQPGVDVLERLVLRLADNLVPWFIT